MTDRRYDHGWEVYARPFPFPISRDQVTTWCIEHVGERCGEDVLLAVADAWADAATRLRDRAASSRH